jgi:hypothetical protein
MAAYTKKAAENARAVLKIAVDRVGKEIETPGRVPPKVLKNILDHAWFAEDQLTAEYLGGVLASSRTPVGRDDRGASLAACVGRLSSYQIRAHYLFYSTAKRQLSQVPYYKYLRNRKRMHLFVALTDFQASMEIESADEVDVLASHCAEGLMREGLIESWAIGEPHEIALGFDVFLRHPALRWAPSAAGTELFMWAQCQSKADVQTFLDPAVAPAPIHGIKPFSSVLTGEAPEEDRSINERFEKIDQQLRNLGERI